MFLLIIISDKMQFERKDGNPLDRFESSAVAMSLATAFPEARGGENIGVPVLSDGRYFTIDISRYGRPEDEVISALDRFGYKPLERV